MAARLTVMALSSRWPGAVPPAHRGETRAARPETARHCARLTSPGFEAAPPPVSATALAEWCGARKGLCAHQPAAGKQPGNRVNFVVSSASSSERGGRMPGRRFASMLLPVPAGQSAARYARRPRLPPARGALPAGRAHRQNPKSRLPVEAHTACAAAAQWAPRPKDGALRHAQCARG